MFLRYLLFCLLCISPLCAKHANNDRVYVDEEQIGYTKDAFYIHLGHTVWVHTDQLYRDGSGIYIYENSLAKTVKPAKEVGYQKEWKCPYCYNYWPIGVPCQNVDCPSKYMVMLD